MNEKTDMERIGRIKTLTCGHCGSRITAEQNRDSFGYCDSKCREKKNASPFGKRKGAI